MWTPRLCREALYLFYEQHGRAPYRNEWRAAKRYHLPSVPTLKHWWHSYGAFVEHLGFSHQDKRYKNYVKPVSAHTDNAA